MARKLQDRLALATFKTKRGWEGLDINAMEPHIDQELKRKRPMSSAGTVSDSSSNISDPHNFSDPLGSSPLSAPFFSEQVCNPRRSGTFRSRGASQPTFVEPNLKAGSHKRPRVRAGSMAAPSQHISRTSWKSTHNLPESSPVYHRQHAHFPVSHGANLSFVSETSTIPDSPTYGLGSDGEDQELPLHSFRLSSSVNRSSPPRTPPPNRARSTRKRKANIGGNEPAIGEEGADLLLYLATSPSPANPVMRARAVPPSTPPSHHTALPSSMMSTPGGGSFLAGFSTPGQQFNFADFVNITPSPAQGAWGSRTPGIPKTPLAAREARRRLNFDSLVPPMSGSPNFNHLSRSAAGRETGLGMELGGDLIP
ncbi:hypothetical protein MMC16_006063 [Acarospora aff. strigata]|nr:hypothetical protein [Acarospora aff. strigata]